MTVTQYICTADGCPNKDVLYNVEDAPNGVVCGGCFTTLEPMSDK